MIASLFADVGLAQVAAAAKLHHSLEQKFLEVLISNRILRLRLFVWVTVVQEQVYSKKMFNERSDAIERTAALNEELQNQRTQAEADKQQALMQQQQQQQMILSLQQECVSLKANISAVELEFSQFKESSAAAAAADATAASARIAELQSEKSAAVVAAQQQVYI